MRRVASPCAFTVQLAEVREPHERRRHVGRRADVDDVDAGRGVGRHRVKKPGAASGSSTTSCPCSRRGSWPDRCCAASCFGIAAVQHAGRAERRAVHRLRQLRLHHVGAAGVDRQADEDQQDRQEHGHVEQGEALFVRKCVSLFGHVRFRLYEQRPTHTGRRLEIGDRIERSVSSRHDGTKPSSG